MKKATVVSCECGGYHTKADCPKAWEEFNQWFSAAKSTAQPDLVAHWYDNSLTERERKAIIAGKTGDMEYGLTRPWILLSEETRMAVRREYRRITSKN